MFSEQSQENAELDFPLDTADGNAELILLLLPREKTW